GSPVTQNFTGIVPFKRKHFALGFNLVNDNIGEVKTGSLNINFSFAYYLNIKNGRLSFGVGAGVQQYRFDGSTLKTSDNSDLAFSSGNISRIAPDFNFGVFYKTNRYYLGISSTHLNNPGRTITAYKADNPATTARHYYFTAGYTFEVDEKFKVTPSTVNKFSESPMLSNNVVTDFSVKTEYQEMVWLGAAFRTSFKNSNAIAFFTGVNVGKINADIFKENIKIGYAYDIPIGPLPAYNNGSHEIFISYEYAPKVKRMMPKFK
ncbi:MAG: PorP/SprF family type IX secretion system membrane protein, partial [Cytophagales bacterium]